MTPLKIVLVGCGKIADGHVEEIQKMSTKATVVAVCDREILMSEQLALRYGIPHFYDNYEQMLLHEKPDVVHITTPPQSHLALAKIAIDAGCHVYVEKPLTLNYNDSKHLIEYTEKSKKKLTVGYSYYFDPPAIELRDLVARGILGEIIHVESFYGYNLSGPFGSAILNDSSHWVHQLPGKLFHNNIDHLLYEAIDFIPDQEPYVHAISSRRSKVNFNDLRDEMDDELRVIIQGESTSFYGTFSSSIRPTGHFTRIYGTKKTVHVDHLYRAVIFDGSPHYPSAIGRLLPTFQQAKQYYKAGVKNLVRFKNHEFHFFSGMNTLMEKFYDSITRDSEPPIKYSDILRISFMIDQIFAQTSK